MNSGRYQPLEVLRSCIHRVPTASREPSPFTADTARYRCSAPLNSLIRECHRSIEADVTHQAKHCHASTVDQPSDASRSNTKTVVGRAGLEPATDGL